eukprot:1159409-Pelagomonas_calceolata.AAC.2
MGIKGICAIQITWVANKNKTLPAVRNKSECRGMQRAVSVPCNIAGRDTQQRTRITCHVRKVHGHVHEPHRSTHVQLIPPGNTQ